MNLSVHIYSIRYVYFHIFSNHTPCLYHITFNKTIHTVFSSSSTHCLPRNLYQSYGKQYWCCRVTQIVNVFWNLPTKTQNLWVKVCVSSYASKLNDKRSRSLIVLAVTNWLNLYIGRMCEKFSISKRANDNSGEENTKENDDRKVW